MSYSVDKTISELDKAIAQSLEDIGKQLLNSAKSTVPVDTGRLKNSLYYQADDKSVVVGSDVKYAPFVEIKSHFLENTANKEGPQLQNLVADRIKESK